MAYPSNLPDDISELEEIETPVVATLENVMVFANRYRELEKEITEVNNYVKQLKAEVEKIEEQQLPQILEMLGMPFFGLDDGSKIELKPTFQGSLVIEDPEQRKRQLDWLVKNGGQDLIKNAYTISFGKGQDEEAKALRQLLTDYDFDFEVKESVHASSLGAFIKDKMANGDEVPYEMLKWRFFQKATIKEPPKAKVKKGKKEKEL